MATAAVTDSNFKEEVLEASGPVVVDFWAEWCGPCKAIGPSLEEIAAEMGDAVKITKINIDENPNTPGQYQVRSIPTLMLFENGEVKSTQIGALPKSKLMDWIKGSV